MKRFYATVNLRQREGGWQVLLESRAMKTPGGRAQTVPGKPLGEALAEEWRAQGETMDPRSFPLRDMVDYALDKVRPEPGAAVAAILPYADTDTLCYRAETGDSLRQRQDEAWDPILQALESRHGIRFMRTGGIVHEPQPEKTLAALQAHLATLDHLTLTAVQNMASIAGSLCVALAALEQAADIDALFAAGNLEEDWQAAQWGRDTDALARRDARLAAFRHAARLASLAARTDETGEA